MGMKRIRDLSPTELKLIGAAGSGTDWTFMWDGGSTSVTFKPDGYNHFNSAEYPAHAHWSLKQGENGEELTINWDQFGTYVMKVDAAAGTGEGSLKGNPADWRKMTFSKERESITYEAFENH